MTAYAISVEVKATTTKDDGTVSEDSVYSWRDTSADGLLAITKQLLVGRAVSSALVEVGEELAGMAGVKAPKGK